MSNAITKKIIDGWSVTLDGDEPRILDEELGARLGFSEPRSIRKLIRRLIAAGFLNDSEVRATVSQTSSRGGRPGIGYLMNDTGTLLVISRSDTKIAHAITRQIVEVFKAARRGQLPAPEQVPVLSSSPLVGDSHLHRAEMVSWCELAARNNNVSVHRIHGALRRQCGVPSVYRIPLVLFPQAVDLVKSLARGNLLLPPTSAPRMKSVPNPAQHVLPFPPR